MTICDDIRKEIGPWPYRLVLAGGWIDQPFVNRCNPEPPGSMVVVCVEPDFPVMERCGMATSTRAIAQRMWPDGVPAGPARETMQRLYEAENADKAAPSGSQDMAGMLYPGISRLDYGRGAIYPDKIDSITDARICQWLESVLWLLPLGPRPEGYDPLEHQNLEPESIMKLGRTGRDAFDAIGGTDVRALGVAMMGYAIWATAVLPAHTFHRTIGDRVRRTWKAYVAQFPGACYAPGGGYLIVASEKPVPGAFKVTIRR